METCGNLRHDDDDLRLFNLWVDNETVYMYILCTCYSVCAAARWRRWANYYFQPRCMRAGHFAILTAITEK